MSATLSALKPVWVDAKQGQALFGLCRTTLTRLSEEGRIKTVSLRDVGRQRGKRLYCYTSIQTYLESRAEGGISSGAES